VLDGSVEIIKALGTSDEHRLGERANGSILGEMSLFSEDHGHTASVRAVTPVSMLEVTREALDDVLRRRPEAAYNIISVLSRRLENAENLTVLDLREKNRQLEIAYKELKAAQAQIIEREKLQHELDIARDIQLSFLPPELPRIPGYQFGAMMIPARSVGGDMYDFFPLEEGKLGMVIGDVSDKGVPASLVMALTYSLMRAEAFRGGTPGDVLRSVNQLMMGMNNMGMFVTLLFAVLDLPSGCLTYARAGHPYPLILDASGQVIEIPRRTGQAVGLLDNPIIDEGTVDLPEGGMLCMFSDGLSEARVGPDHEQFEREGVAAALSQWGSAGAQEICQRLWRIVQEAEHGVQQDDFTVMIVKKG
jgi:phosphoserine phosphatase RsbU/P